ncbi:MAG: chemotaxis protein CheA [Methylococcaceae bacterium]
MAVDLDDEILHDFLIEAGEILELLGEQLVELEQSPEDLELLNAIFRGFHTIKGGAGFLALDPLVSVCHQAEDVFNVLRQGERTVSAELMDVILEVVDVVNLMFEQVKSGNDPEQANESLLTRLKGFTSAGAAAQETIVEETVVAETAVVADVVEQEFETMLDDVSESTTENSQADSNEISEDEFDNLLDELHGKGKFSAHDLQEENDSSQQKEPAEAVNSGDITEEEFDSLLDNLHGKGQFSATKVQQNKQLEAVVDSGDITDEEFDNLLDDLHGKGSFNGAIAEKEGVKQEKIVEQLKIDDSEVKEASALPVEKTSKPEPEPVVNKAVSEMPAEKVQPVKKATTKPAAKAKKSAVATQGETTVRVDTVVLDDIMNMVGELVLVRNRFQTLKATTDNSSSEQLAKAVSNLDVVTADLQLAVMKTRMQPIKKVFGRFPRVVRDLSRSLKKEIKLELVGEETDLDKNLVEALADPLVHLVRNAVDHGIESPDERVAVGKPREGLVILTASQEGDHILLSIKDNGKGMNADVLRRIVVEKGLMDEETAARLDDKECYNLIFMPGFSTKIEISDVSGRGVGMDVVKTRISQMNGVVEIDSIEGVGTTIIIKVPLTLAIMPTLMVVLGGQAFALPLASVLEILDLDLRNTNVVDGQLVIMVRERALPVFFLTDWLINDPNYVVDRQTTGHVVVVNAGGRQIGFVVDQLIGQEEVVIKPLGAKLQGLEGLAGATITGDGKIALILDVPGLMTRYAS